jgi:hypothetical protein
MAILQEGEIQGMLELPKEEQFERWIRITNTASQSCSEPGINSKILNRIIEETDPNVPQPNTMPHPKINFKAHTKFGEPYRRSYWK